jgi:hypothetical protein
MMRLAIMMAGVKHTLPSMSGERTLKHLLAAIVSRITPLAD